MARSRKRQSPKTSDEAYRIDGPGSERKADTSHAQQKGERHRRTWEFQLILDEPIPMFRDHPLSGLTPAQRDAARAGDPIASNADHPLVGLSSQRRTQERIDAIASILARLAIKAASKGLEVPA